MAAIAPPSRASAVAAALSVTLAPECVPASMIEEFIGAGLIIAAGHSEATSAEMEQAAALGVRGVTHLFNAMSQLQAREPGLVGAALTDDRLFAGIICDGIHVDATSLRIAFRCKGRDRLMLVTDAMPLVGTNETQFTLQGRQINLQGKSADRPRWHARRRSSHDDRGGAERSRSSRRPAGRCARDGLANAGGVLASRPNLAGSRPAIAPTSSHSTGTLKWSAHGRKVPKSPGGQGPDPRARASARIANFRQR